LTYHTPSDIQKQQPSFDALCFGSDHDGFFPDNLGFDDDGFGIADDPFGDSFAGGSFSCDSDDVDDSWWDPTTAGTGTTSSPTNKKSNQGVGGGSDDAPIPFFDGSPRHRSQQEETIEHEPLKKGDSRKQSSSRKSLGRPGRNKSHVDSSMVVPVPQRRQGDGLGSSRHSTSDDGLNESRSSRRSMDRSPKRDGNGRSSRIRSKSSSGRRTLSEQFKRHEGTPGDDFEQEDETKSARQRSLSRSRRTSRQSSAASVRSAPQLQDEESQPSRRGARRKDVLRSSHHSGKLLRTSTHSTGSSYDSSLGNTSEKSFESEFDDDELEIQINGHDEAQLKPSSSRRRVRRDELANSSDYQGDRSRRSVSALSPKRNVSKSLRSSSGTQNGRSSRPSSNRSKYINTSQKTDTTSLSSDESQEFVSPTMNPSITQLALSSLYSD
jgi:hypothetical protein